MFWTTRVCVNYLAKTQQTDFYQKALDYLYWAHRAPRLMLEKKINTTHNTHCAASATNRGTLALLMEEHLFLSFVHCLCQVIKFVISFGCTLRNRACSISLKLSIEHQSCSSMHYTAMLGWNKLIQAWRQSPKRFNLTIQMTDQGYFIKGKNTSNLEISDKQNNSLRSV